ncbi:MAG TPA: alpha/beta fold hydrolase [Pseudonocardiaceae bacterium]|jgi:pimeloyl-ACP methyl ester carboxylesterase|nr:alpha/beta fold hydrolase [Pseudonocardiaceae bacterium]
MNEVLANGLTMHVEELWPPDERSRPQGTAVLIHGIAPDNLASWYLTLAYPLAQSGMRVLLYDLRGHGRSEQSAHGYRFPQLLDDLDALMTHWDVSEPVYLMGNSFGGALAFGYAARYPERVAGVVAIEAEVPTPGYFSRLSRVADGLTVVSDHGRAAVRRPTGLVHAPRVLALVTETSIREELPAGPPPAADRLAAIDCPVLCLYGGESSVRLRSPAIRRLLPQTRTIVFAGQRHTLLTDHHHEVGECVLGWLAQLRGSGFRDQDGYSTAGTRDA